MKVEKQRTNRKTQVVFEYVLLFAVVIASIASIGFFPNFIRSFSTPFDKCVERILDQEGTTNEDFLEDGEGGNQAREDLREEILNEAVDTIEEIFNEADIAMEEILNEADIDLPDGSGFLPDGSDLDLAVAIEIIENEILPRAQLHYDTMLNLWEDEDHPLVVEAAEKIEFYNSALESIAEAEANLETINLESLWENVQR